MGFRINPDRGGLERDYTPAAEIANKRPALVTRVQCVPDFNDRDPRHGLRGDPPPEPEYPQEPYPDDDAEDMCARFNRQLRGGHGETGE